MWSSSDPVFTRINVEDVCQLVQKQHDILDDDLHLNSIIQWECLAQLDSRIRISSYKRLRSQSPHAHTGKGVYTFPCKNKA
jgi:hypothetical protein